MASTTSRMTTNTSRMQICYDYNFVSPSDHKLTAEILQTKLDTYITGARKYYVGKTFIRAKANSSLRFDELDPQMWDKKGILGRERAHRRIFGNNSKMIILGLITRDSLPAGINEGELQEYTLSLEQGLIANCKYVLRDPRIINQTQNPGQKSSQRDAGYVIYLIVEYTTPGEHSDCPIIIITESDDELGDYNEDDYLDDPVISDEDLALLN